MQSDATMFAGLVGASRVLHVSSIMTLTSHMSFAISTPHIAKFHRHDKGKAEFAETSSVGSSLVKAGKPVSLSYQYRLNTG
jgi:hypothetical protein